VQKLSVINNMERYMREIGANDKLLALILGSLDDWDDNMQIECAKAFIAPLQQNMVNTSNKQQILKLAVEITTDDCNENQVLIDCWIDVFTNVVGKVEIPYVSQVAVRPISEMPGPKNPFPKRKRGNRLLTEMALAIGEDGFEEEPILQRLMMGICRDTNYKIRLDGAIWFKRYF